VSELSNEKNHTGQQLNNQVVCIRDLEAWQLQTLLRPYGLVVEIVDSQAPIPGSFWGDEEAGLITNTLYVQLHTPVHSALHEACHYICMDPQRRASLDTNAGGDYDEENAVCYLQILLADHLPPLNKTRMMADMDAWGYSFRLGSASRWFGEDAEDARNWLIEKGIITNSGAPTWELRGN
jgi:hypothetical protein